MIIKFQFNPLVTVKIIANQKLNLKLPLVLLDQACVYNVIVKSKEFFERPTHSVTFHTADGVYTAYTLLARSCEDLTNQKRELEHFAKEQGAYVMHDQSDRVLKKQIIPYDITNCNYPCAFYEYYQSSHQERLRATGLGYLL